MVQPAIFCEPRQFPTFPGIRGAENLPKPGVGIIIVSSLRPAQAASLIAAASRDRGLMCNAPLHIRPLHIPLDTSKPALIRVTLTHRQKTEAALATFESRLPLPSRLHEPQPPAGPRYLQNGRRGNSGSRTTATRSARMPSTKLQQGPHASQLARHSSDLEANASYPTCAVRAGQQPGLFRLDWQSRTCRPISKAGRSVTAKPDESVQAACRPDARWTT